MCGLSPVPPALPRNEIPERSAEPLTVIRDCAVPNIYRIDLDQRVILPAAMANRVFIDSRSQRHLLRKSTRPGIDSGH